MSTRREFDREEPPPRSKCISCLCFSWKFFSCVFSHVVLISLVIAYCIGGAWLFNALEANNELEVSRILVLGENDRGNSFKKTVEISHSLDFHYFHSTIVKI